MLEVKSKIHRKTDKGQLNKDLVEVEKDMDWLKKKEKIWKSILNSSKENISTDAAELGAMQELIVCLEEQLDKETHICEIEWLRKEAELFEQKLVDSQNRIADYETRLKNIQAIIAWLEGQIGRAHV